MLVLGLALVLAVVLCWGAGGNGSDFKGVDETVIEKFAEEAGREAKKPLIDMGEGDLLLMMFLAAGACGGFIGGYYYRVLFCEKKQGQQ
ncbi:MAG TPA: cobalt transporter [Phycisphaerales bacterium]|nr:cobalt transporter [Phycisphaerales bacterium]